ncbi:MAG: glycosyltransferase family 4 protein [Phycisphaerae bacterium]|jgi:glycosyltransferase involved in cell wall biosynthesis|nr:glycosyltransferase family 4 protein [Phycisphaerae bacterium]MBT5381256.1 glycosyltransferase family 4 protein [Phycisphaerae bacterium]MBT5584064.1 glycosyltransferase family 4 protein [Phycisphaerae bacterium]MBT5657267.1 glycosyltransferase family 4 protein [Phycisphaerae bacterium]MDG2477013.1 glycosyltransferase family 4 protein [Phycisphaerales bacterium]
MSKTVLFVANRGYALTSSRESLIRHFLGANWTVVIATADDAESRHLVSLGAHLEPVHFNRGGLAIGSDIKAYRRLCAICRHRRPTLVQQFHTKPVIAGSIAARRTLGKNVRIVNTITGLGGTFLGSNLQSHIVGRGFKSALSRSDATIFQNADDQAMFLDMNLVPPLTNHLITGSGVDVDRFAVVDRTSHNPVAPVIVMIGRLLKSKGIPEFAEVASRIRKRWPKARFVLAGERDPNHPDSISDEWIQKQPDIEFVGRLSDITPLLSEADLFLFPSYYREGVPRVIMEAAATGLPTVAFDVPGVKEAVRNEQTGYLVADRDLDAMTSKLALLIDDTSLRRDMGRAAREVAATSFDVRTTQARYLTLYRSLGLTI